MAATDPPSPVAYNASANPLINSREQAGILDPRKNSLIKQSSTLFDLVQGCLIRNLRIRTVKFSVVESPHNLNVLRVPTPPHPLNLEKSASHPAIEHRAHIRLQSSVPESPLL